MSVQELRTIDQGPEDVFERGDSIAGRPNVLAAGGQLLVARLAPQAAQVKVDGYRLVVGGIGQ
jgi:hypothetical protein